MLVLRIEGNSTTTITKSNINNKKIFHEAKICIPPSSETI
jgi:hypothetical protein